MGLSYVVPEMPPLSFDISKQIFANALQEHQHQPHQQQQQAHLPISAPVTVPVEASFAFNDIINEFRTSKPRTTRTYALDTVGSSFLTANVSFSTALSTHDELLDKQDSSTPTPSRPPTSPCLCTHRIHMLSRSNIAYWRLGAPWRVGSSGTANDAR
jgi:hypothetical protein